MPRHEETHGQVTVRSWERATAPLADRVVEVLRKVEGILELPPTEEHVMVYVLRHLTEIKSAQGWAMGVRSIYLNPRDLREAGDFPLAHELTHWRLRVQGIVLPIFLEEGLADVIAARIAPYPGSTILAQRALGLGLSGPVMPAGGESAPLYGNAPFSVEGVDLEWAYGLGAQEFRFLPDEENALLREIGVRVVSRAGIQPTIKNEVSRSWIEETFD